MALSELEELDFRERLDAGTLTELEELDFRERLETVPAGVGAKPSPVDLSQQTTAPAPATTDPNIQGQPTQQTPEGFFEGLKDNPIAQNIIGNLDLAKNIIAQTALLPVAGMAGIVQGLNPFAEERASLRAIEDVQALAPELSPQGAQAAQTIGGIVQDVVGAVPKPVREAVSATTGFIGEKFRALEEAAFQKFGPIGGTIVGVAPEAALEIIPGFSIIKKARNVRTTAADDIIQSTNDNLRQQNVQALKADIPAEAKDYGNLVEDIRKEKVQNVARQVLPDQEILKSAENLNVDLNPSHYSTNRKFIEVEQSLKSVAPGSRLGQVETAAIVKTGEGADNLIRDLSGEIDKSLVDIRVKNEVQKNIANLNKKSDIAYATVNKAIPAPTKVVPTDSKAYIKQRLDDLGQDVSLLTTAEKQLKRLTDTGANPTYGALDQVRRNVGDALGKNRGPFKDDERGVLEQTYKVLSNDQQGVADAFGVGGEYALGRKLVFGRKNLEKKAVDIFGKDVERGTFLPKLRSAAVALTKGDVSRFNKLLNALPPNRRREVAATMLNEIFTQGSRTGRDLGQGFVNAFASLNRNKGAKDALFGPLPTGARARFDDIGRVATGIFKSKAFQNNSRTAIATSLVRSMDDGTFFGKILSSGQDVLVGGAIGSAFGGPVAGAASGLFKGLLTPKGKSSIQAADAFLTSPKFKRAIEDALTGDVEKSNVIMKSQVFKNWVKQQPPDIKKEIAAIGLVPWLVGGDTGLTLSLQEEQ
jgi:hypothetical protein